MLNLKRVPAVRSAVRSSMHASAHTCELCIVLLNVRRVPKNKREKVPTLRRNTLRVAEDARLPEALSFTLLIKIHEHTLPRHALAWTHNLIFLVHRLNLRCCHNAGYAFLARLERRAALDLDGI